MRRKSRGWRGRFVALITDGQSNDLMDMVNSGVPYEEAGKVLGLTRSQVKHHVEYRRKLYGEVRRGWYYWPEHELITARTLSQKGIPRSLIAQLLGRTRQSVIGALWRDKQRGKRSKATD